MLVCTLIIVVFLKGKINFMSLNKLYYKVKVNIKCYLEKLNLINVELNSANIHMVIFQFLKY